MTMYVCFISICIIFALELKLSYGQYECPEDEVLVDCVDACNTCELTGQPCVLGCIPGCDCTPGYVRDRFGVCIPRGYCNAEDSQSVPDGDDITLCPDSAGCSNICRRTGFIGGTCIGIAGRTCHCFNIRNPGIRGRPPLSPDDNDDDDGDDVDDGDSGIESRRRKRCKKVCIGKKKRRRGKCKCKGIKAG